MNLVQNIPVDFYNFLLVALFSLIIGLEQRRHHLKNEDDSKHVFGTDRTFTFFGILGYILYIIDKPNLLPFLIGSVLLTILLSIAYYYKAMVLKQLGLTSTIIALITYSLAPLIYTVPLWIFMAIIVIILIVVEIKDDLLAFTQKFDRDEFIVLAKFITISGVILPLLSHKPFSASINISPYKFWLAIVAISGISYLSYILKKFIFPHAGLILTALLGGLYSSTATTVILAKKSKSENVIGSISGSIILATGVMYVRLYILALIFNGEVAKELFLPFLILVFVATGIGIFFLKNKEHDQKEVNIKVDKNPLEFKTALIFGILFAFFAVLTNYVISHLGREGVNILSLIVGVTDIDPYILNLFQTVNAHITTSLIVSSTILATASNNLIKMIYALILGNKKLRSQIVSGFLILIALSFILTFV